jgi:hypothetical protein
MRLARYNKFGVSYMKRKAIQIILVIAIALAIPMSSTYTIYYTVAAADFLSPDLKIEASDQENLLASNLSKLKGSQSGVFFNEFQLTPYLFGLPSLSSQKSSLDQKTIILRC